MAKDFLTGEAQGRLQPEARAAAAQWQDAAAHALHGQWQGDRRAAADSRGGGGDLGGPQNEARLVDAAPRLRVARAVSGRLAGADVAREDGVIVDHWRRSVSRPLEGRDAVTLGCVLNVKTSYSKWPLHTQQKNYGPAVGPEGWSKPRG